MLKQKLKESGSLFSIDDFETLNYKEYSCPYCQSTDRERLYQLYLQTHLDKNNLYKLLDIAPSTGLSKKLKSLACIDYRSADLYLEADDKVDIMNMDIYEGNKFDIFICSHVLEHVQDDKAALKELYRILKPGGLGITMVPIVLAAKDIDEDPHLDDITERWRRFAQYDHVRLYSKEGFMCRLQDVGFSVQEIKFDYFDKKKFVVHGLSKKSVLYIVTK